MDLTNVSTNEFPKKCQYYKFPLLNKMLYQQPMTFLSSSQGHPTHLKQMTENMRSIFFEALGRVLENNL